MKLSTLIFSLLFLLACSNHKTVDKYTILKGKTMGSTYEIAYDSSINIQEKIDYILGFYSYLVSTYDSQSIVSKFNNNNSLNSEDSISYNESKHYFVALDSISRHVYKQTNGSFNPGIGALINYWGFGNNKQNPGMEQQVHCSARVHGHAEQVTARIRCTIAIGAHACRPGHCMADQEPRQFQ